MARSAAAKEMLTGGKEPNALDIVASRPDYQGKLGQALGWFTANRDNKDARKYLADLAKKIGKDKKYVAGILNLSNDATPTTMGWCAHLLMGGATLSVAHAAALDQRMKDICASIDASEAVAKASASAKSAPVKNVRDYLIEKVNEFLGELEGALDEFIDGDNAFSKEKDVYNFLHGKQIPAAYVPFIVTWCDDKIKEFGTVLITKDVQLKEGYDNFTKKQLGEIVKWLASIKNQAADYGQYKKVTRAPRKRKAKPASVQVAKMKYKVRDDAFKLTSVQPAEVIGADQLWAFNTKTRVLAVYRAQGAAGLGVKGTTLVNYDTDTSKQKRLRKPEDTLKKVLSAGKVALRKLMDEVKAVEYTPNGRISKDTILVRVA